ncbi:BioY family transporter [Kurthia sibirica]|uniref:Biotin transporter n=2 Tax=Kurthia sibirica TaxID=202750 RepID=A0A2U3AR85_9BACL|nr:BioY family transporter [Kurthia sibirica]
MWIVSALFAAVIAIFAQLTIPLPLIPITGQTFAIGLAVTILGLRYGSLSVLLYILLGAIGIPVFSGMSGGLGIITGPTGGYIIGFLPAALVMGIYLEKTRFTSSHAIIANIIGMCITLLFGAIWLKYFANLSWPAAFTSGIAPFLIVGVLKAIAAALAGVVVRQRLLSAKLLTTKTVSH